MPETRREKSALQTLYADNTTKDISEQDLRDGIETVHQEEAVATGDWSSRPSSGNITGDIYLPNDGCVMSRAAGASTWANFGPITQLTAPVDGDYAWINQGSSTVTDSGGGIYLYTPAASGNSLRIRKKSAPSTPYTITAGFMPNIIMGTAAGGGFGLCFRQSSDGKLATFRHFVNGSSGIRAWIGISDKWRMSLFLCCMNGGFIYRFE